MSLGNVKKRAWGEWEGPPRQLDVPKGEQISELWVTSAAISPTCHHRALVSHKRVWRLYFVEVLVINAPLEP